MEVFTTASKVRLKRSRDGHYAVTMDLDKEDVDEFFGQFSEEQVVGIYGGRGLAREIAEDDLILELESRGYRVCGE